MIRILSSLRVRLIALVILATFPVLLLTAYNGFEQRKQAEADALEDALQLANFAATKNETLIEDTRVTLVALSHAMNFAGNDLGGCGHLFNHLKEVHFPFYSAFYVADLEGNILCTMPNGDVPSDLLGCHHYQSLIASNDFVVSEYHICRNTGKGVISMGYPVWDGQDNKIGVINVGIDLAWFNEFAAQADLPSNSTLTVFDRDGIILAQYPDPDLWVGKTLPEGSIHEYILEQKTGTKRGLGPDNVDRLYAFLPLEGSEDSVILSIGIPLDYAFAAVQQTMTRNLILIGAVTLLALMAAWFFGDVFVGRPIDNLVKTTRSLAAGDLNARTNAVYSQGEFGTLNRSVDDMAQALADRDTERRHAEAAIREYAENLERSNRDLMDFANIASHDLQEPLRKISTFSDILLIRYSEKLDRQGKDYLHRIHASTRRMQSFIIDLLTFSRISTKTQPPEKVNLNETVQQVLGDLEVKISESNATVNVGDLPNVFADPVQMDQLFLNLISNSIKFKKSNIPVIINISGEMIYQQPMINGDGKKDFCEVRVSDNGIGFDEKYLDRIFQPFQRLRPNEYEGTGMGLAICRKIVERHGGILEAHSKPDEGAIFITRIPIPKNEGSNP